MLMSMVMVALMLLAAGNRDVCQMGGSGGDPGQGWAASN